MLFTEPVDRGLAKLANPIVKWEVARSITHLPTEEQSSVLTDHPDGSMDFSISSVSPTIHLRDDNGLDPRLSILLRDIEAQLDSHYGTSWELDRKAKSREIVRQVLATGRVRFGINMSLEENATRFVISLKPSRASESNHWQRTYGSGCFMQIRLSESLIHELQKGRDRPLSKSVWEFLMRPLIFSQRIYQAAVLKEVSLLMNAFTQTCRHPS